MARVGGPIRNSLFLVAAQGPLHAINAVHALLVARWLGAEAFGTYAAISALMWSLAMLFDDGLAAAISRESARAPASAASWFSNGLVVSLGLGVGTSLMMGGAGLLLGYPPAVLQLLPLAALMLLLRGLWITVVGGLNGAERFAVSSALTVAATALAAALGLVLVASGWGVAGVFAGGVAANVAATVLALAVARRILPPPSSRWVTRPELTRVTRAALPFGLRALAAMVYYRADAIMLSVLAGFEAVGLFRAAFSLFALAIVLPGVAGQALLPFLSRMHDQSPARIRAVFERHAAVMVGVGAPLGVLLAWFAEPIVDLLYGTAYHPSAPVLGMLAGTAALSYLSSPITAVLTSGDRQRRVTVLAVLSVATSLALNGLLIPELGERGAALASLGSGMFSAAGALLLIGPYLPRLAVARHLGRLLGAATAGISVAALVGSLSPWLAPLALALYVAIYVAALPRDWQILPTARRRLAESRFRGVGK